MKKIVKYILVTLLILFVLVQFYPRNNNNNSTAITQTDISNVHHVPEQVMQVLKTSCYDCHSNHTTYPWYAQVQPVSMWLGHHVDEGKDELNFSEFGQYNLRRQYRKLEEINEQVKSGEMPLDSYTWIHRDARLSEAQRLLVADWVSVLRDSMQANYPPDSLRRKK